MKKILFLAAVVFFGLGFSSQTHATPVQGCPGDLESCTSDSDCPTNYFCGDELEQPCAGVKGVMQLCYPFKMCKKSGGICVVGGCKDGYQATNPYDGGMCVDTEAICCLKIVSGTTGTGTTAGNNCSGTCARSGICPSGLSPNSDTCSGGGTCCVGGSGNASATGATGTCSGSCKDDMCNSLDGLTEDTSGKCADTSQYCCKSSGASDRCIDSCKDDMCATLDGMTDAPGKCSDPSQYCCKSSSAISGYPYESDTPASGGPMFNIEELGGFGLPDATVSGIIKGIVMWLLGIFGFLGIIAFVISGIYYLTAAGDAEQEKKAKLVMKMAIMGILVGLMGFIVIQAINMMLSAKSRF